MEFNENQESRSSEIDISVIREDKSLVYQSHIYRDATALKQSIVVSDHSDNVLSFDKESEPSLRN